MRAGLFFSILIFNFTLLSAQGLWKQKADFGGHSRCGAAGFSIGDKGYIGTGGYHQSNVGNIYVQDFWEWNSTNNTWSQKNPFPGGLREGAVGFAIGSKGYIATGASDYTYSGPVVWPDLWEYDPTSNSWTQKTDLPAEARYGAMAFSIGNKGYILGGSTNCGACSGPCQPALWEWDQNTDSWTQKADFPKGFVDGATAFSINNKGYICTGTIYSDPSLPAGEFWEWDQSTNIWTQKPNFPGSRREGATSFVIGNKAYVGNGSYNGSQTSFYEWDQTTEIWTQVTSFPGTPSDNAVAFGINGKGYLGTGFVAGTYDTKEFWEFDPTLSTMQVKNQLGTANLEVFPNPGNSSVTLEYSSETTDPIKITIHDSVGQIVFAKNTEFNGLHREKIDLSNHPKGIYFLEILQGGKRVTKKIVLE